MHAKLSPRKIFLIFIFIIVFLFLAHLIGLLGHFFFDHDYMYGFTPLFSLNTENNIPTFYASFALMFVCVLLFVIGSFHRKLGDPYIAWLLMSLIFLFLSFDEMVSIHEKLIDPVRNTVKATGIFFFAWVIPYGIGVVLFIVGYSRFLLRLPRDIMVLFITGGAIFVSGALGFELLGGRHDELYGTENMLYSFYNTTEELLEMLGIAIFIYALLLYISRQLSLCSLSVEE